MSPVQVKAPAKHHSIKSDGVHSHVTANLAGDISDNLAASAHRLLLAQRHDWPMLRKDYASLPTVQTRSIPFDGFEIILQYNPARLISSAAKVDAKSIRDRRCFLCESNLPHEQRSVPFNGEYLILCNPFPIFPEHFTIPHREHRHQQIAGSFEVMLSLAKDLASRYTVFYNGPRCGASAPDHLHFQAGTKDYLPLCREYDQIKHRRPAICESEKLSVYAGDDYLRRFISIESKDASVVSQAFAIIHSALQRITGSADEPLLNILTSYEAGVWRTVIFPRAKHRPNFYFAEGDHKILLSPATVEMGGVCALPVKKDFERMTREKLIEAYEEVTLAGPQFRELCDELKAGFSALA